MDIKWQKASYSIEAAILIPLFFGILLSAMNLALSFYEECSSTGTYKLEVDVMETFYTYHKLAEIKGELEDD
uniref:TadE/TadG family type IV pilus assembly protein n=1 Tax=Agathobacter sp. TaxID=2021311 RepID=UPI004056E3EA